MTQPRPARGLLVTGSDTEVGKTHVTCSVAAWLRAAGVRVGVYKPAASGAERRDGQLVSEDAVQLWEAAGRPLSLAEVCPQVFEAPLAPHLAALAEGREINCELLSGGAAAWNDACDVLLVEGAGGLMSPLGDRHYVADVALELGYPLLVVVPNQLGAINQTLQTLIAARSRQLEVAALVLNHPRAADPADVSLASNEQQLRLHCGPPVFALQHGQSQFEPEVRWLELISAHRA